MLGRVSKNFIAQLWSMLLSFGDRFILVGVLLRAWDTDIYSDWTSLFATAGLLLLAEMGLNIYFGNKWQEYYSHQNDKAFQRTIAISLWIYLVLGILLILIVAAYAILSDFPVFALHGMAPEEALVVFILLSAVNILHVGLGAISQIYRGRSKFAAGIFMTSLRLLAVIIVCPLIALAGGRPVHVAGAYLLIELLLGWTGILLDLKRRFPDLRFTPARPNRQELADLFHKLPWFGLIQGTPVAWNQFPILILSMAGLGGAPLVSFVITRTLVNFARQVIEMLARSVAVETAGAFHLGDHLHVTRSIRVLGSVLSAATGAMAGGLLLFAAPLMELWTGKRLISDNWLPFWLLLPTLFTTPSIPLINTLTFGNLPRLPAFANLTKACIGLGSGAILLSSQGVAGMAMGLAIGEVLGGSLLLPLLARHQFKFSLVRYFSHNLLATFLAAAWSLLIAWSLERIMGWDDTAQLLLSGVLWFFVGFLPPVFLSLPKGLQKKTLAATIHFHKTS